jgi:hypothetical protein
MSRKPQTESYGNTCHLPLVIGIIGHGDFSAETAKAIEAELRACFEDIRKRYPHTPTLALSALATDADRFAARVALAAGSRLVVVLASRDKRSDSNISTGSPTDFDQLLKRAEHCFELPPIDDFSVESSDSFYRDHVYAGAYIARNSQMLFAIRNGDADQAGAVVDRVVQFKLAGVPEPYAPPRSPLDLWESGPVRNIPVINKPVEYPAGYTDEKTAEEAYDKIYQRIDMFNRDCDRLASQLADRIESSKRDLFSGPELESLPLELAFTRNCFGLADAFALHFQRRTRRALLAMLALTFLVALVLKVSPLFPNHKAALDSFYLFSLVVAFGLYYAARRGEYKNRYQDYRALAEGLRVRFFWGLAGLKDSVADRYLRMQGSELDWIRSAIRIWNIPTREQAGASQDEASQDARVEAEPTRRMNLVLAHWVEGQYDYFTRTARRNGRRLKRLTRLANTLFFIGVLWTVFEILKSPVNWVPLVVSNAKGQGFIYCLTIALGLTPIIGVLLFSYVRTSALAEHAKQYGRMSALFSNARQCLTEYTREDRYEKALSIIRELGQEALAENGAWVFLHRQRPIETPRPK